MNYKNTDPDPKCPKCGSYDVFLINPKTKLDDYKTHCKDCQYTGNLDMFHCADPEKLLKAIYD